jgi:Fe-S-cluster containining protein
MADEAHDLIVRLPTATGVSTIALRIKTAPMQLVELVGLANVLTNVVTDAAVAASAAAGKQASCRAGCGACCRQLVPLSIPEALHVARVLADLEEDADSARARFEQTSGELERHHLIDGLMNPRMRPDDDSLPIARDYFALGLSCPFLVDGSCSIHPLRPVRCREYSVTTPAEQCVDPYRHGVDVIPMPMSLTVVLTRLTAELTQQPPRLVPLPLAPKWADRHAELAARTWPGFELVTRFLSMLAEPSGRDGLHAPPS